MSKWHGLDRRSQLGAMAHYRTLAGHVSVMVRRVSAPWLVYLSAGLTARAESTQPSLADDRLSGAAVTLTSRPRPLCSASCFTHVRLVYARNIAHCRVRNLPATPTFECRPPACTLPTQRLFSLHLYIPPCARPSNSAAFPPQRAPTALSLLALRVIVVALDFCILLFDARHELLQLCIFALGDGLGLWAQRGVRDRRARGARRLAMCAGRA